MRNLIVLTLVAIFFMADIFFDIQEGIPVSHIWHEVVMFGIAFGALIWQIRVIMKKNDHIESLNTELLDTKQSYQEWKAKTHASARNQTVNR